MALLERVATLLRANLDDLIARADDPGKMLQQVILDMQNQLIQVKTQLAVAMAEQHQLADKLKENELADRKAQVELLKSALHKLEQKLAEAQTRSETVGRDQKVDAALNAARSRNST